MSEQEPFMETVFFTDRAIYRPGQTIQFKGICLRVHRGKDNYELLKGEEVSVVFWDVNHKEIARQKLRANDYGSFAGSFTAPRDRLMGTMLISAEGWVSGHAQFRVEEYKRPKFEVTLDAPKTAAKLNDLVSLTGHAMGYTGAAVDGAEVKYRVVREVRMPWWWGWCGRGPQNQSQDIAHGTARTQTDGSFKIEFTAKPDPKILETNEPTFIFHLTADVTDSAGETRSADHDIRVGYTALEAMLHADDWQTEDKPVELKLETKTLDGEPQAAEGSVKIYELQPPEKVQRAPLRGAKFLLGRAVWQRQRGRKRFDESKQLAVGQSRGGTAASPRTPMAWPSCRSRSARALIARCWRRRIVLASASPASCHCKSSSRTPRNWRSRFRNCWPRQDWEAQPGEEFMALWGTGYDQGRAFVEIEQRDKIIQRFWTEPGRTQQQIKLAVTEAMRGGFTLHVTQVRENRAYLESRKISVPWKNKELALTWEHFTSKLQPGQKETWTTVITGPGAEKSVAETVATLYDESLDAFAPHNWPHGFWVFHEDNSTAQAQFLNYASQFNRAFGVWNYRRENVEISYRHFPFDLTQNLWGNRFFGRYASRMPGGVIDAMTANVPMGGFPAPSAPAPLAGAPLTTRRMASMT